MAIDPSAVWDFAREVVGVVRPDRGRTLATVTRVDADGTTWVTTGDGGEAPASSAAAGVSVGDTVALEWDGSAMGIRGNVSNPSPAGSVVRRAVERTRSVADAAQRVADAVNQHFFADTHGIHVTEATQDEWEASHSGANVLLNSAGQLFRDGLNNLLTLTTENGARALTIWDGLGNAASNVRAIIGEVITLGKAGESHAEIDYNSLQFIDGSGNTFFLVNDAAEVSEATSLVEVFESTGSSSDRTLTLQHAPARTPVIYRTDGMPSTITSVSGNVLTLAYALYAGSIAIVQYETTDYHAMNGKTMMLGVNENVPLATGAYSASVGTENQPSGNKSMTVGNGCRTVDPEAFASGGDCLAAGEASVAHGLSAKAIGIASFAQGGNVVAYGPYQHVFGRFNEVDANGGYALIVGNGTSASARSNALAVGWDGSVDVAGTTVIRPDTGWVTVNSLVRYRIRNGICFVYGWSGSGGTAVDSSGVAVATLPAAARPSYEVTAAMSMRGNAQGQVNIATNGVITGYCWTASRVYWGFMLSYPVDY